MKFPFFSRLPKPDPEKEQAYREQMSDMHLSVKDKFAMLLAAFITIFLPCVVILLVLVLGCMFLFGAF